MLRLTIKVTKDCEDLITDMPRGYEYELGSETYNRNGRTVTVLIHDESLTDLTPEMALVLNTHPGVVSYNVDRMEY